MTKRWVIFAVPPPEWPPSLICIVASGLPPKRGKNWWPTRKAAQAELDRRNQDGWFPAGGWRHSVHRLEETPKGYRGKLEELVKEMP